MRRTPNIDRFRLFRPRDCPQRHPWCLESRNVYELPGLEHETKLFGTERMVSRAGQEVEDWKYGDWDWDIFFLMQDAAPRDAITIRLGTHPDPFAARNFREEPQGGGAPTNRNLHDLASHLKCRKLAGSALVGLLKPGKNYSGNLFSCPHISAHCNDVLRWVLEEELTKRRKTICCLGKHAFDTIVDLLGMAENDRQRITSQRGAVASIGRFNVAYLWHPRSWPTRCYFPPGGRAVAEAAWKRMAAEAGLEWQ